MDHEDKTAEEMANLVLDVYHYALDNNLDIVNREDVVKILKTLKSESSNIDIDVLIEGLVALDKMTKAEVSKREKPQIN